MLGTMLSLAAICLNEEEFMEGWLRYHYDSFEQIIVCEGAARNYPAEACTADGLSTDRTAEIVYDFPDPEHKIQFIQHGWAGSPGSLSAAVPAKMELRNRYAERLKNGYVYTLDIDEFLHPAYVTEMNRLMDDFETADACALPFLHLWQDSEHFITGGFAEFSHYRLYRWREGSRYRLTHNWPSGPEGTLMIDSGFESRLLVEDGCLAAPAIVHYGFLRTEELDRGEERLLHSAGGECDAAGDFGVSECGAAGAGAGRMHGL